MNHIRPFHTSGQKTELNSRRLNLKVPVLRSRYSNSTVHKKEDIRVEWASRIILSVTKAVSKEATVLGYLNVNELATVARVEFWNVQRRAPSQVQPENTDW